MHLHVKILLLSCLSGLLHSCATAPEAKQFFYEDWKPITGTEFSWRLEKENPYGDWVSDHVWLRNDTRKKVIVVARCGYTSQVGTLIPHPFVSEAVKVEMDPGGTAFFPIPGNYIEKFASHHSHFIKIDSVRETK